MNSKLPYSHIMFHKNISTHALFKMTLGSKSYVFLFELDFKKPSLKLKVDWRVQLLLDFMVAI